MVFQWSWIPDVAKVKYKSQKLNLFKKISSGWNLESHTDSYVAIDYQNSKYIIYDECVLTLAFKPEQGKKKFQRLLLLYRLHKWIFHQLISNSQYYTLWRCQLKKKYTPRTISFE